MPHIDRVLSTLGLPPDMRTNIITSWLPGVARHKNIVSYRAVVQADIRLTGQCQARCLQKRTSAYIMMWGQADIPES